MKIENSEYAQHTYLKVLCLELVIVVTFYILHLELSMMIIFSIGHISQDSKCKYKNILL